MLLVDSSVWIDYFNGVASRQTELLDDILPKERPLVGDLILTEVLQGFRSEEEARRAQALLAALEFAPIGGYDLAVKSAANYRLLRGRGITVRKTIDVIIATFCIEHHHVLLHADRDFDRLSEALGLVTA
jgi:predicted nucleic acid-binding protein